MTTPANTTAVKLHSSLVGPNRRTLLVGGAAAVGASLIRGSEGLAQSTQSAHTFSVGSAEVIVLSDGAIDLPVGFMLPGREQPAIDAVFQQAGQSFAGLRSQINVAVIKLGTEVILIDAGGGPDYLPTLGKLAERMDAAGIKPEAITKVVFTHAHADHLWGVIDPLTNDTMFEKAEHVMTVTERDYWLAEDQVAKVPDAFKTMAIGTHRRLKMLANRLKVVPIGAELRPGVQLVDTSGHTPGHVSVMLRSGSEQVLIGGDVVTQSVISFAAPDWRWGPDMDSDRAVASRRRILDQLATDRVRLLGYHLPWPGLGHVERTGSAYRYVPA